MVAPSTPGRCLILPATPAISLKEARIFITERPSSTVRFISQRPWKGGAALEVDWNGRLLWEVRHPDHHHDGIRLRNGNVLLICLAQLPQDLAPKIKGGMHGTEHNGEMYADYLVEMTTDGKIAWEWRTWEHLDPEDGRHYGGTRSTRRVDPWQWCSRAAKRRHRIKLS